MIVSKNIMRTARPTQKSAAAILGSGSFPVRALRVNMKRNSMEEGGC